MFSYCKFYHTQLFRARKLFSEKTLRIGLIEFCWKKVGARHDKLSMVQILGYRLSSDSLEIIAVCIIHRSKLIMTTIFVIPLSTTTVCTYIQVFLFCFCLFIYFGVVYFK